MPRREQAATCLKALGIPIVLAGSVGVTYQRNAFNNGFMAISSPLVRIGRVLAAHCGRRTVLDRMGNTVGYSQPWGVHRVAQHTLTCPAAQTGSAGCTIRRTTRHCCGGHRSCSTSCASGSA